MRRRMNLKRSLSSTLIVKEAPHSTLIPDRLDQHWPNYHVAPTLQMSLGIFTVLMENSHRRQTIHHRQSNPALPSPRRLPKLPKTSPMCDDKPPPYVESADGHLGPGISSHIPTNQQSHTQIIPSSSHSCDPEQPPSFSQAQAQNRKPDGPSRSFASSHPRKSYACQHSMTSDATTHSQRAALQQAPYPKRVSSSAQLQGPIVRSSYSPSVGDHAFSFESAHRHGQPSRARLPHHLTYASRVHSPVVELELQPFHRHHNLRSQLSRTIAGLFVPSGRRLKKKRPNLNQIPTNESLEGQSQSTNVYDASWVLVENEEM
ncbi:hypothetical protein CROQUDRAFT_110609 [Cronartium quercuum f. sp. fusiforme G11]|uniref:Uncharacterized protein n=1 Tax=Cronartium quercuum f. sp. fusiforme G11 TaxID=708437 RepID=A0A9P6N7F3_9BASI|nr:hypothetical protein CROQUDRAFT_110609 [Cronartium quercuum f. sp. fusiforme G11]